MIKKFLERILFFSVLFVVFVSVSIVAFLFTFNQVWEVISTPTISVPKLVGLPIKDAVKVTGDLNLILKIKDEVQDETQPEGYIISQDPPPGAKMREENPIYVVIATRSLSKKVPNMVGLSIYDAEERLSEKGISLVRKAYVYDDVVDPDTVIAQFPSPGVLLGKEPGVSLLISKGKKPLEMPSLYGLDIEEAEYVASLVGLNIGEIVEYNIENMPDGEVIYQDIPPGTQIKKGDLLSLGIAKNGTFRTGAYSGKVSFQFIVPYEREKFTVKIIKRDDNGDKVVVKGKFKGGEKIEKTVTVSGVSKLYISLDGILYEVRRIN